LPGLLPAGGAAAGGTLDNGAALDISILRIEINAAIKYTV
jgi:hypothetical protein